jgi:hypothetical protein
MFKFARVVQGLAREHIVKAITRSGEWPTVRKHFLEKNPTCAACGGKSMLNVHHKQPFHLDPRLELDENNLITLCIKNLCHVEIGHGDDYKAYNPNVEYDAKAVLASPKDKDSIVAEAKKNRKYK